MVSCSELLPGGAFEDYGNIFNDYLSLDTLLNGPNNEKYMCPLNLDSMLVEGSYEDEIFQYVKIEVSGCQLGPDQCTEDKLVAQENFKVVMSNASPNILAQNEDEVINYMNDARHFYFLDPSHIQTENMFFGSSSISMN